MDFSLNEQHSPTILYLTCRVHSKVHKVCISPNSGTWQLRAPMGVPYYRNVVLILKFSFFFPWLICTENHVGLSLVFMILRVV